MRTDAGAETRHVPGIGPERLHFAAAIGEALGALRDVALPLLIGVVLGGHRDSLAAIGLGLLAAAVAALVGFVRWRATSYTVTATALHFTSGVFSPDETVVPLPRIQAVDTVTGPVQRLFGVTGLHVQTPGGGEDGDVVLAALSRPSAVRLRAALGHPDLGAPGFHLRLTPRRLLAAALTAPQLGVLLPIVGGLFGLAQDDTFVEGMKVVQDVDTWRDLLLPGAIVLGAALLISFLGAVVAFAGFEVRLVDDRLRIRRGFWERRAVSVPLGRIDGVQVVASPLRRPLGLVTLRLEATSLGGRETIARTLFPLLRATEVAPFLARVAPELAGPLTTTARPPGRALRRFLVVPLLGAGAGGALLVALVPALWPLVPAALALAAWGGFDAYALAGLHVEGGRVVARTRRWGTSVTLVARHRRLQAYALRRTPPQRRAGLATLSVTVARGTRIGVRHLEQPLARELLDRVRRAA